MSTNNFQVKIHYCHLTIDERQQIVYNNSVIKAQGRGEQRQGKRTKKTLFFKGGKPL